MQKIIPTILALLATAALFFMLFQPGKSEAPARETITRVWLVNPEKEGSAFFKKQAAAWEKATGKQIYLRSATAQEALSALSGDTHVIPPDLIIGLEAGEKIYAMGYALILLDTGAPIHSPAPTSLLFSPPTPSPGPTFTPAPTPDWAALSPVLCPERMKHALPGCIVSENPVNDLQNQKARAALLTAGQAALLQTGYQAHALPRGAGVYFRFGQALSAKGASFLAFLKTENAQRGLRDHGLYSPFLPLYGSDDPLRAKIDQSIPR